MPDKKFTFPNLQKYTDTIKGNATLVNTGVAMGQHYTHFNIDERYEPYRLHENSIVTGMTGFTNKEVSNMARNQGWESLPF